MKQIRSLFTIFAIGISTGLADAFPTLQEIDYKIKENGMIVFHSFLKKNTPVKIINPVNSKVLSTKIYSKANYPDIFVITISKEIAEVLDLDLNIKFKCFGPAPRTI